MKTSFFKPLLVLLSGICSACASTDFTADISLGLNGDYYLKYKSDLGYFYSVQESVSGQDWSPMSTGYYYGDNAQVEMFVLQGPPPPPPVDSSAPPPPPRIPSVQKIRKWITASLYIDNGDGFNGLLQGYDAATGQTWQSNLDTSYPTEHSSMVFLRQEDAEVIYDIEVMAMPTGYLSTFEPDPTKAPTSVDSIRAKQIIESSLPQIVAALSQELPDPGPVPDPASQRRLYRVVKVEIDTNKNGIYDWWEIQYGYQAFAKPGQPGYCDPEGDPDNDTVNNRDEQAAGTDPNLADTDGDGVPDGHDPKPKDKSSYPPVLHFYTRSLTYDYSNNEYNLGSRVGSADWDFSIWHMDTQQGKPERNTHGGWLETHPPFLSTPLVEWKGQQAHSTVSVFLDQPTFNFQNASLQQSKVWLVERPTRVSLYPSDSSWMNKDLKKSIVKLQGTKTHLLHAYHDLEVAENHDLVLKPNQTASETGVEVNPSFATQAAEERILTYTGFPSIKGKEPQSGYDNLDRYFPEQQPERQWIMVPAGTPGKTVFNWTDAPNFKMNLEIEGAAGVEVAPTEIIPNSETTDITLTLNSEAEVDDPPPPAFLKVSQGGVSAKIANLYVASKVTVKAKVWNLSMKNDDDIPTVKIGEGAPNIPFIQAVGGVLYSTPVGDDKASGGKIHTGANGIRETDCHPQDVEIQPVIQKGKGASNQPFLSPGPDGILNTAPEGDDGILGHQLTTGADGLRQTKNPVPIIHNQMNPTTIDLQNTLNRIYGKQMNVFFEVTFGTGTIPMDIKAEDPRDRIASGIIDDKRLGLNACFDLWQGSTDDKYTSEEQSIRDAGYRDTTALMNVYFIPRQIRSHSSEPPHFRLYSDAIGWARPITGNRVAYIGTVNPERFDSNFAWVASHEMGHLGGLEHCSSVVGGGAILTLPSGFPLLVDKLRLMKGDGILPEKDPVTKLRAALLTKDEWLRFRTKVKTAIEAQNGQ